MKLTSVKRKRYLYQLLAMQPNFYKVLQTIKITVGASIEVLDNGNTVFAIDGKHLEETEKKRFENDELTMLLGMAGLDQNN